MSKALVMEEEEETDVAKLPRPDWCRGLPEPVIAEEMVKDGQVFYNNANIDRMDFPIDFSGVLKGGGAAGGKVDVIKFPVVEGAPERFAVYIRGVLSPEECLGVIGRCNEKKFGKSLINIGRGRQAYYPDTRSGYRCIIDDGEFAGKLFSRIEEHLPTMWENRVLHELNERLRVLCYESNSDSFEPHFDGCYARPPGHPHEGDKSKITVQLYLNDVPPDNGGHTTMFLGEDPSTKIRPEQGAVLLFSQNIYHEGTPLTCNGLKYAMRTEAMYRYV